MRIGVPREIKNHEYRVGLTPESVSELVSNSHEIMVEKGAGLGIGATDADYAASGAEILETAADVFDAADMIVKVKEPQPVETAMLKRDQILFRAPLGSGFITSR